MLLPLTVGLPLLLTMMPKLLHIKTQSGCSPLNMSLSLLQGVLITAIGIAQGFNMRLLTFNVYSDDRTLIILSQVIDSLAADV